MDSIFNNNFSYAALMPQCGNFNSSALYLSLPINIIKGIIYKFSSPELIRILQLISITLLFNFLFLLTKKNIILFSIVISFLNVGVLPLALIIGRPEILILLGLVSGLYLSVSKLKNLHLWYIGCLLFTISILPKSVIVAPMFIGFILVSKTSKKAKVFSILSCTVIIAQHFYSYSARFKCEDAPWLNSLFKDLYLTPALILSSPSAFMEKVLSNLASSPILLKSIHLINNYPNDWIPNSFQVTSLYNIYINLFIFTSLAISIYIIIFLYKQKSHHYLHLVLFAFSIISLKLLESYINWYSMLMYIPINAIILAYSFSTAEKFSKFGNLTSKYFSLVSIFNSIILLTNILLTPQLKSDTKLSKILPFDFKKNTNKFKEIRLMAKNKCQFHDLPSLNRLITDDYTYFSLKETNNPISSHYVLGWYSKDILNFEKFFIENKIPGFVLANCTNLPLKRLQSLKSKIIYNKEMCCLNLLPIEKLRD